MNLSKKYSIICLLAILALASFFRLWQLDSIPPGLYPDEAINGMDALKTLEAGQFKVFYPENNGREGLFIWLIAFIFKLSGPSAFSIRLVSAILGILTVLGLYLLTKELFNRKIALLSSFFLAVSFWHTNFSRIGFRAILVPFLLCFSFYFLWRAFRKNSLLDYLWAGIFFGLGFYTYISFRAAVLLLGIVILLKMVDYWRKNKPEKTDWSWLWKKAYLKDDWWKVDLSLLMIFILILPLGLYFISHPQDFLGRAGGVSIFNTAQPLKELSLSILKTLGMFNVFGDWNWRHNLAGSPMLARAAGILFVFGLVLVILSFFLPAKRLSCFMPSQKQVLTGSTIGREKTVFLFLFSWFIIMLLPAIFTFEGMPHALRTIGVIPVIYIFAALGLVWLIDKLSQAKARAPSRALTPIRFIIILLLVLALLQPTLANFNKYFFDWAKNPHVAGAFRQDLVNLTNYLNNLPDNVKKYVIVNESGVPVPYPDGLAMPAQTIIFESKIKKPVSEIKYLLADVNSKVKMASPPLVIVPLKYQEAIFQQLSKKLPGGKIENINGFTAYKIE